MARMRTMDEVVESSLGEPRFRVVLLGTFTLVALVLACVGVVQRHELPGESTDTRIWSACGTGRDETRFAPPCPGAFGGTDCNWSWIRVAWSHRPRTDSCKLCCSAWRRTHSATLGLVSSSSRLPRYSPAICRPVGLHVSNRCRNRGWIERRLRYTTSGYATAGLDSSPQTAELPQPRRRPVPTYERFAYQIKRESLCVDSSCFLVSARPSFYPVFGLFWTHIGPEFGGGFS